MGYFKLVLAAVLFTVSLQAEIPSQVPAQVRQKYAALYALAPQTQPDGSVSFHQAHLFKREGVNVLFLKGDRFEMAYQHGRLLKGEITDGALPPAALMFERTIYNGMPKIPLVTKAILNNFKKKYPQAMLESMISRPNAQQFLSEAYGMSDGSGRPLEEVLYAAVGPESLQVMAGDRLGKSSARGAAVAPSSQCSEFVAWDQMTGNGEMLIGRNTDYPLNGYYDRHPTVIYYEPTDGTQKYMAVTSAGLHTAGVIGLNESGIYLGIHTIPASKVSTTGLQAFSVAQEILRRSKTFDEAVALFSKVQTSAGWVYMLVSTHEKRAASIELSSGGMALLPAQGTHHVQTNHFRTKERSPEYLHVNLSVDEDTIGRLNRIEALLQKHAGQMTDRDAMAIMADKFDPFYGKVRGVGNVVAVHTTMTSVVVKPESGTILVATGRAPVSLSNYLELPLVERADPASFGSYPTKSYPNVNYGVLFPKEAKAEQYFIESKIAYESGMDVKKAFGLIQQAMRMDTANPSYQFVGGILALKAGNPAFAIATLKGLANSSPDHFQRLAHYYLGRIDADNGFRAAAVKRFQLAIAGIDANREHKLLAAAQEATAQINRKRRYRLNTAMLALMMQEADMAEY